MAAEMGMEKMLARNLSVEDKIALANMTLHPGFKVLTKMLDDMCVQANADVIKLNPLTTEKFEEKLATLQYTARATNALCNSLRKSLETLVSSAMEEEKVEEIRSQIAVALKKQSEQSPKGNVNQSK